MVMGNKRERQSNIELLRILSMLMVLGVHIDGASLGLPEPNGHWEMLTPRASWKIATESLCIVGVNCFTMISGYFGIHLTLKKIGTYLFQCIFYSAGIYSLAMIISPSWCSWKGWIESWLVLSHTDLWYVPAYFALMLLSPFINAGLDKLSKRQSGIIIILFTAFNIWCGWWCHGNFNPTGYTVVQLIMVYMIGGYMRRYIHLECKCSIRLCLIAGYIISVTAVAISAIYLPSIQAFAYNSPFVLAESGFLFLFFATIRIHSNMINGTARGAFAVYLIHKTPLIWINVMKPFVITLWNYTSLLTFSLSAVFLSTGIYAFASGIDIIRQQISAFIFRNRQGVHYIKDRTGKT